jgi:hypothetical protein
MTAQPGPDERLTVQVSVRNVYGKDTVYPENDVARTLAELAGHRTLTRYDLQLIRRLPNVRVEVASPPAGIPAWVLNDPAAILSPVGTRGQ